MSKKKKNRFFIDLIEMMLANDVPPAIAVRLFIILRLVFFALSSFCLLAAMVHLNALNSQYVEYCTGDNVSWEKVAGQRECPRFFD